LPVSGIAWDRQIVDTTLGKARLWDLVGPSPTDRGKRGTKKSLLVDAGGGPLAAVLAAVLATANTNDHRLMAATLDALVPDRPTGASAELYADRGDDHPECDAAAVEHGYVACTARVDAPDPPPPQQYRRTRWIVGRMLAWLSRCRALLVRYEKQAANHLGLLKLACILLWYRRARTQAG
jgi:putative transposase